MKTPKFPGPLCNPHIVCQHAWEAWHATDMRGAVIECGVAEGHTSAALNFTLRKAGAKVVQLAADTFCGFPYTPEETKKFKAGDLAPANGAELVAELRRLEIYVLRGKVEETLPGIHDRVRFSFVFLDLDIERPTHFCWDFFKDKILPGGRIGFHDYREEPGHSLHGIERVVKAGPAKDKRFREVHRTPKGRDAKFIFFERV